MRAIAWGPSNRVPPCVPEYVQAFDGNLHGRGGPWLNDAFTRPCPQAEIAEGHWIGVRHDGTVETFKVTDEETWRAKAAMAAVQAYSTPGTDPDRAIHVLRSSADLVGLDLPDMMEKLEAARKAPGEDLVEVFKRTWKKAEAKDPG